MAEINHNRREIAKDFVALESPSLNMQEAKIALATGEDILEHNVKIPVGCRLVRYDEDKQGFKIALVLDSGSAILYYSKLSHMKDTELALEGVVLSLAWTNNIKQSYKRATENFSGKLFSNYIIEQYNVVFSDIYTTYGEILLWKEQLNLAMLRKDRQIAWYDPQNSLVEAVDEKGFDEFLGSLWGDNSEQLHRRAVISKITE